MPRPALLALALCLALPAAAQTTTPAALAAEVRAVLDDRAFADAFWGAQIVNLATGETLLARNADKRFIPASNMKLVTTAAALDALGPDFRYTTRLYADGERRGGTLHGALVVRGAGDPTLGGRYADGDPTRTFRAWADSLAARGIRRVTGPVIGDDDVFDDVALGRGWSWDDLVWAYAAETSGLQFNEGTVELDVIGTAPGRPARVVVEPAVGDFVRVTNASVTTEGGRIREGYARDLGANDFTVTTSVPTGRTEEEAVAVVNPTLYFVTALAEALRARGIETGGAVDGDDWPQPLRYDAMTRVALHHSPPLAAIAAQTNTDSNNLYAEHLLRTVGVEEAGQAGEHPAGSTAAGVAAAELFLQRAGVAPGAVTQIDGSGLSGMNRLTPSAVVAVLRAMDAHPDRPTRDAFYASLAVGGESGTIERRYAVGDARGNVRAKTGFITGARTLSGYVTSARGDRIAFALMCNSYSVPTSEVNAAQDRIVEMLADYTGR